MKQPLKTAIELSSPASAPAPEVKLPDATYARIVEINAAREAIKKQAEDEAARLNRELEEMAVVRRPFNELVNARGHLIAAIDHADHHRAKLEEHEVEAAEWFEKAFFTENLEVGSVARWLVANQPHWVAAGLLRTQLENWIEARRVQLSAMEAELCAMARERGLESDLPAELKFATPKLPDAA